METKASRASLINTYLLLDHFDFTFSSSHLVVQSLFVLQTQCGQTMRLKGKVFKST